MRSSPTVLQSSLSFLSCFFFPVFFRRLQHTVDFFVPGSHFFLLRSLLSLFSSCKSSCRLHKYKRAFFGVVVCATLALFPRCFSVFHLDNHGSWEHQRNLVIGSKTSRANQRRVRCSGHNGLNRCNRHFCVFFATNDGRFLGWSVFQAHMQLCNRDEEKE